MQTALSVRETVTKVLDLLVYISVYFISMVVLIFSTDWRLAMPLIVWFCLHWYFARIGPQAQRRVATTG